MEGSAKNEPRNDSQPPMDKWEKIGYHRVIGGFYFYIIFAVVAVGYVLLLPVFIPYPERARIRFKSYPMSAPHR